VLSYKKALADANHETGLGLVLERPYDWDLNFTMDKYRIRNVLYDYLVNKELEKNIYDYFK